MTSGASNEDIGMLPVARDFEPGAARDPDADRNIVFGSLVTGDGESYRYLVESIRRFPPPAAFAQSIERAGFRRVTYRTLTGGIVAIHSGWKI